MPRQFAGDEKRYPCAAVWKSTDNERKQPQIWSKCGFCYPIYPPAPIGMRRRPRARSHFDAVRAGIGAALRSLYSDVLNEPLPDKIAELLRQLDQQLGRLAQQKDSDST
jgi:Anti-sigma factor NepR